jgi:putative ABC transport system ATP-binding protein
MPDEERGFLTPHAQLRPLMDLVGVRRLRVSSDSRFLLEVKRFVLRPGDRVAIVGDSGVGKSTCLDMLALTLAPTRWKRFDACFEDEGHAIGELWGRGQRSALAGLRARHIGYILQTGGLLPFLTVRENVALPLRLLGEAPAAARARAEALLQRLQMAGLGRRLPTDLSLGQRQRVAVARALVHRPALVLADEPTASLDRRNAESVLGLFAELLQEQGRAAIWVTHSAELAAAHGFIPIPCRVEPDEEGGSRSVISYDGAP